MEILIKAICKYFDVKPADLYSNKRQSKYVDARNFFFYILKYEFEYSASRISKELGIDYAWVRQRIIFMRNNISQKYYKDIYNDIQKERDILTNTPIQNI